MKKVRRKLWSGFWGLVTIVAIVVFAAALAVAAYEPNVANGVRVLGSFLERIPVRVVPRKPTPSPVAAAPVAVPLPSVVPPPLPGSAPSAAPALAAPSEQEVVQDEEWDAEDELHSSEDEMPAAPSEDP